MSQYDIFFIIMMAVFMSAGVAWYFYGKDDSKIFQEALEEARLNVLADELSKTMDQISVTTKEATEEFEKFKEVANNPKLTINQKREALGLDKIKEQLENSKYDIAYMDSNTTIEQVSPPKEYCQCEYCGTFYNEFMSNCKNCGAQIRMPSELYKRDYIIKLNYSNSRHNVFDI